MFLLAYVFVDFFVIRIAKGKECILAFMINV